jgi:hypothetical protein
VLLTVLGQLDGRHQVDVLAASVLQREHHRRQLPRGHRLAVHLQGDLEILAEHAAQVAAGGESRIHKSARPRPSLPDDRCLPRADRSEEQVGDQGAGA